MSDSVELKPCLFCKTATQQHLFCLPTECEDYEAVECQLCGARGPVKLGDHAAITAWNTRATDQLLDEMAEALEKAVHAINDLIADSIGVAGLHLNGDVAHWEDLRTGGRFETWLSDFDAANEALQKYREQQSLTNPNPQPAKP